MNNTQNRSWSDNTLVGLIPNISGQRFLFLYPEPAAELWTVITVNLIAFNYLKHQHCATYLYISYKEFIRGIST